MSEKAEKTVKELAPDARAALKAVFDVVPRGKFASILGEASEVEFAVNRGLRALMLLDSIRQWMLDSPALGEDAPFVKEIDKLIARD